MPSFSCKVEDAIPPGVRLDRYIALNLKILSRSQIKARTLKASLNGTPVKISRILKPGDLLELTWSEGESPFLIPQNLPLEIIYEDERVIVLNKAQGMVVHPGAGNRQGTLANALLYRRKAVRIGSEATLDESALRPGIVHRLDKDTSGVMIAAWNEKAHDFLARQFKARKVRKIYAAIVQGCPKEKEGCIDKKIIRSARDRKTFTVSDKEGRASLTYYRLVKSWLNYSLLLLRPKTGRTHQLRVHLKHLGNPILGDPVYGRKDSFFPMASLMLHAKSLSLVLPAQRQRQKFATRLPRRFTEVIRVLNKEL